MMGSTFNGGMMMNLDKTLYFNPRDNGPETHSRESNVNVGREGGMHIQSDMKVSSLLQNKNLEDLIVDENSLSHGHTAKVSAQITPNAFSKEYSPTG